MISLRVLSLEKIFDIHVDALYAFARKRVDSSEDIEDLIQETFASFLQDKERFRQDSAILTYLTAILKYKIYDLYRKRQREVCPGDEALLALLHKPLESVGARARKIADSGNFVGDFAVHDILFACIQRLKTPYYEAFIMRLPRRRDKNAAAALMVRYNLRFVQITHQP